MPSPERDFVVSAQWRRIVNVAAMSLADLAGLASAVGGGEDQSAFTNVPRWGTV
jgi:hypothetical protein